MAGDWLSGLTIKDLVAGRRKEVSAVDGQRIKIENGQSMIIGHDPKTGTPDKDAQYIKIQAPELENGLSRQAVKIGIINGKVEVEGRTPNNKVEVFTINRDTALWEPEQLNPGQKATLRMEQIEGGRFMVHITTLGRKKSLIRLNHSSAGGGSSGLAHAEWIVQINPKQPDLNAPKNLRPSH